MELEAGDGGGDSAAEDVESGFQLHAGGAGLRRVAGELLRVGCMYTKGSEGVWGWNGYTISHLYREGLSASDWIKRDLGGQIRAVSTIPHRACLDVLKCFSYTRLLRRLLLFFYRLLKNTKVPS